MSDKLTYKEALEAVRHARTIGMSIYGSVDDPPHPNLPLDKYTQTKLVTVTTLMASIGRLPGDVPVDQTIRYHMLDKNALDYLENGLHIKARSSFAPFWADYINIFQGGKRLPHQANATRFYSHLIHYLYIEAQLVLTQQYFYGLGLYDKGRSFSIWSNIFSEHEFKNVRLNDLYNIAFTELHGRVFLDHYIIMIRAQWDKFVKLGCIFFDLQDNWSSVEDGIATIDKRSETLPKYSKHYMDIFTSIAKARLDKSSGWLRSFRDGLLHSTGQHSSGVIPQKKSLESTSELWDKALNEHNWLREAMMAALIGYANALGN